MNYAIVFVLGALCGVASGVVIAYMIMLSSLEKKRHNYDIQRDIRRMSLRDRNQTKSSQNLADPGVDAARITRAKVQRKRG